MTYLFAQLFFQASLSLSRVLNLVPFLGRDFPNSPVSGALTNSSISYHGTTRIKKIPYQAPPTQLGPRKCTFWKNAFLGPNVRIFIFYVLSFPLQYLKTAQKTVQSLKNAEKLPKPLCHFSEILYKDKS